MCSNGVAELENFLHHSSEDRATRTMATTMYVLAHWQLAGRSMSHRVPSMLFVNGGTTRDPLDHCAENWSVGGCNRNPSKSGCGPIFVGDGEDAQLDMHKTILMRERTAHYDEVNLNHYAAWFEEAKDVRFGYGRVGYYARMWDEELGWMTDTTRDIILRLDRPEDHEAFRNDLFENPTRLIEPRGAGQAMKDLSKTLSIAGSLTPAQWDSKLTEGIVKLGLPILFLPHLADAPLNQGVPLQMLIKAKQFAKTRDIFAPVVPALSLPAERHLGDYGRLLRKRLRHLPAAYEFSVLTMAHQLGEVCARIVQKMTPGAGLNAQGALYMHLHLAAFRGVVIGIHSLAYHGLGIDTGCDHADVAKLLDHLRTHGPMSPRDVLRKFQKFDAATRDQLLQVLEAEGVIRYDAKMIVAVPLPEFIQALHDRDEFAEPSFLRSGASNGNAA